jgi:hypothetical protein
MIFRKFFEHRLLLATVIFSMQASSLLGEGFIAGTLVKTPSGYTEIEKLQERDLVICYDFSGQCVQRAIIETSRTKYTSCIEVRLLDESLYAAPDHKFYLPNTKSWIAAHSLRPGQLLLKHCTELVAVDQVNLTDKETEFYDITVADYHNFCASAQDIHVHNFLPAVGLTITWLIGEGIVVTGTAAVGGIAAGCVLWKSSEEARKDQIRRDMENRIRQEEEQKRSTHHDATTIDSKREKTTHHPKTDSQPDFRRTTFHEARKPGDFPPGYSDEWKKIKSADGFLDPDGYKWAKDHRHKNRIPHWDVSDKKGNKIKEVDFDGKELWPHGPKNKNKKN